jgi:hypothetical protein
MDEQTAADINANERTLFDRFLGWLGAGTPGVKPPEGQNEAEHQEGESMAKTELITALVANAKCKFSKEKLESWDEADLTALSQSLAANEEEGAADSQAEQAAGQAAAGNPQGALPTEITQFAEMIRGLGGMEKLAQALGSLSANSDQERTQLIAGIVANCRGALSADDLAGFNTNKLRDIYGSYLPRDYSANAGAYRDMSGPEDEELLMHWPMFEKKEG